MGELNVHFLRGKKHLFGNARGLVAEMVFEFITRPVALLTLLFEPKRWLVSRTVRSVRRDQPQIVLVPAFFGDLREHLLLHRKCICHLSRLPRCWCCSLSGRGRSASLWWQQPSWNRVGVRTKADFEWFSKTIVFAKNNCIVQKQFHFPTRFGFDWQISHKQGYDAPYSNTSSWGESLNQSDNKCWFPGARGTNVSS